jgi:hypothetical protein
MSPLINLSYLVVILAATLGAIWVIPMLLGWKKEMIAAAIEESDRWYLLPERKYDLWFGNRWTAFWDSVERPADTGWTFSEFSLVFIIITAAIVVLVVIIGVAVLTSIQSSLASLNGCNDPTNMSAVCQTFRKVIENAGQLGSGV